MSQVNYHQFATPSDLQTLTGSAGGGAIPASGLHDISLVGAGGVTVTGVAATNTITITGGFPAVSEIIADLNPVVNGTEYICNKATLLTATLPTGGALAPLGATIGFIGKGVGFWKIQANAGQVIHNGAVDSSVAGSVTSTERYACMTLVATVAGGNEWTVIHSYGAGFVTA